MIEKGNITIVVHAAGFGESGYGLNKECIFRIDGAFNECSKLKIAPARAWWVFPAGSKKKGLVISNQMKEYLMSEKGVPEKMIFTGKKADNTFAEVMEAVEIIVNNNLPRVLFVCSSGYHIPRVKMIWRSYFHVTDFIRTSHASSLKTRTWREFRAYVKDWSGLHDTKLLSKLLNKSLSKLTHLGPKWVKVE